jgi:hypothetical protein
MGDRFAPLDGWVATVSEAQFEPLVTAGLSEQELIRKVAATLPVGVRAKVRDESIVAYFQRIRGSRPSSRSIRRALEGLER